MGITWKSSKVDGMPIKTGKDEYNEFEIRSWPVDESGEGRFQLCADGFHKGNCKTLAEAKELAEQGF